jgi:hypothetical protein
MIMYNPLQSIAFMRRSIRKRFRDFFFLVKRSSKVPIGIKNKLRMWKNGFLSESYLIYGFESNNLRDYISDYARLKLLTKINGYYAISLYDKLYFSLLLKDFEKYLAKTYGLIKAQRVTLPGKAGSVGIERIADLCREKGALVLKPLVGTQGHGLIMVEAANGGVTMNGRQVSNDELLSIARELDDYLVVEFIKQHSYASAVFPQTNNTVRIMTLWDEDRDEPFIAMAVQRFGNSTSFPVDNWTQGGICALVNVNTGVMGKAVPKPSPARLHFVEKHPETASQIEGVTVPHWDMIKTGILEMAATVPFIPCIGWDVIVTASGFKVIEGNNCPGLRIFQVHSPLLADPRIKRFFDRWIARIEATERQDRKYKLPYKI